MKKLLLIISFFLTFPISTNASHVIGGEIGWTCLSNGKYQFKMTVYIDCAGINWGYNPTKIDIVGNPYPETESGTPFSTIAMKPDSNRWVAERYGDTSPTCTNQYGSAFTCQNRDQGTIQQFFYLSDPITLKGIPPTGGWNFFWEAVCCRPSINVKNVNTEATSGKNMLLRAAMYPTKNRDNASPCIDSSPLFKSLPNTLICRRYEFTYNTTAIDTDLDSLIYSWDRSYNGPIDDPDTIPFFPGFSQDNPTPDKTFDIRNIPATLDPLSGIVKMAIYSGSGVEKFYTVTQVDSYREGEKISSVYRELPFTLYTCPNLPSGLVNNPPKIKFNGIETDSYEINVTAGQEIKVDIEVWDFDSTGVGIQKQVLTLVPDGLLFSRFRDSPTPCPLNYGAGQPLILEPCAFMQNTAPTMDTTAGLNLYKRTIKDTATIKSQFIWQTDCKHIQTKNGAPGTNEGIYNFVMRVSDDHCPIPGINYPTITVRVKDPLPLTEPIMKGVDVGLDGKVTYQWVPPIDSTFTFDHYIVQTSTPQDANPPSWLPGALNPNLKKYSFQQKSDVFPVFINQNNILQKIPNRDWYFRLTTVSGCKDDIESVPSQPARVIEPNCVPGGVFPHDYRSAVNITWNPAKPDTASTYDYFEYESKTHYYIWQNDSVSNGGVADSANWYLRDSTLETEINLTSNVCGDYAAFRIEARDTVVTWKHGSGLNSPLDSLDTLTFSTFSIIDTLFMVYGQPTVQRVQQIGVEVINADYPAENYQWIDCNVDTLIANANSRELVLSDTGTFAVITSNGPCMDTSDCFTFSINLNDSIVRKDKYTLRSLDPLANYQWYDCNKKTIIQGANKRNYQVSDTGKYAVIVSVFNYADTSDCIAIELNLNDSIVLIGKDTLKSLDDSASFQWYNCGKGAIIPGGTNQLFLPKDTGYYAVIVSDFGYSDTSACLPYFPVGLPKVQFKEKISYYPNPTTGLVQIKLGKTTRGVNVLVRNIQGQLLKEKQIVNSQSFPLELPQEAGIYFIQLTNEKGERANLKVVKQ